ncbi:4-hydroxyacetophenone monooxygenase [Mycolicibacter minnesotensis]|uniref:4-hydroxyacetophenone monooxygenase n=2 Tax=Mycobacteriaceae TaxID=1762 RepID=A0A7I7R6D1_9MYCO|nr:NAD(P)/FAD-dependent oxidoreductase [Mycolicibacter minnesotensis]ORA99938.1 4-hydroxyacetophenone monooxygenase [Mycolicibacter minnesotensis]BBY33630.1 putative monooxygenase [Mycolicibacter minnesotensis]
MTTAVGQDRTVTTVIIGAGLAGLGAAIRLLDAGIEDIVVLERASEVGGTWRDNTYPGVACDVPSLMYSYSFEPNPRWSQTYASGAEIQQYIVDMVDRRGLRKYIEFGQDVSGMAWDDSRSEWVITTTTTQYRARTVIASYGPLARWTWPKIDGIEDFGGTIMHTAQWDHDFDFSDKTVAVIGTGSTAVQVIPQLVGRSKKVRVFQRTPGWVLPRVNKATPSWLRRLYTQVPSAQRVARSTMLGVSEAGALAVVWNTVLTSAVALAGKRYLAKEVNDRWLRRSLTPNFRPGCKRMLVSDEYYRALQAPHCELITWPIARISATGVMTCEGVEHSADVIVCATGYEATKTAPPIQIVGRDGRSLNEEWARGSFAYKSVNVAGYPNLFFTFGPNSGPGHISALVYVEAQIEYAVRMIELLARRGLTSIEVRADAQQTYNRWIQGRLDKTTWNSGGCSSWYLTEDGFNSTMFPGFASTFRRVLNDVQLQDYVATGDPTALVGAAAGPGSQMADPE